MLPKMRSATRVGLFIASHTVDAARTIRGTTACRIRRMLNITAAPMPIRRITINTTTTIWSVSIRPKLIESGESHNAMPNSAPWMISSESVLKMPPVATADGRSSPNFWRNRIWIAVSAATGTARFENDIDDWSSMLGHNGMRTGTVPRNATAYATSVRMPSRERQGHVGPVRVADRIPELHRVADPAEEHRDRRRVRPPPSADGED